MNRRGLRLSPFALFGLGRLRGRHGGRAAALGRPLRPLPQARHLHESPLLHREQLRRGHRRKRADVRRRARVDGGARPALALHGSQRVREAQARDRGQRRDHRYRHRPREAQARLRGRLPHRGLAGLARRHRERRPHRPHRRRASRPARLERRHQPHPRSGGQRGRAVDSAPRPLADLPHQAREVRGQSGRVAGARRRLRLHQAARLLVHRRRQGAGGPGRHPEADAEDRAA